MRIVLVEPQHPGNIGAVARAMANFGLDDLAMVNLLARAIALSPAHQMAKLKALKPIAPHH